MKNLMAIFSIVVLFASAMTTIGCDEKKDSTPMLTVDDVDDFTDDDGVITAAKYATKSPALAVSNFPKKDKAYKVALVSVAKNVLEDKNVLVITKVTEVDVKANITDTEKVTIPATDWVLSGEYEFHVIATTSGYKDVSLTEIAKLVGKDFKEAWSAIVAAQKEDDKSTVIAVKQKALAGKTTK